MPHIQDVIARIEAEQLERNELGELHPANMPPRPDQDCVATQWLYTKLHPRGVADQYSEADLIGMAV